MEENKNILSIENASVGFRTKGKEIKLLENLNLTVKKGELTGLIGRNGAGKSTLLRCMVRLHQLLNGIVRVQNQNIFDFHPNEFAMLLAYSASGLEYSETMTVQELVSLGRYPYTNWIGSLTLTDFEEIDHALDMVGIKYLSARKLIEISDGERQKVMVARTLAQNTPIIVLDEPTAFLDLPSKYDIISILHELTRKGKTVIFSTHDLNIAMRFSDKIWLIDGNSIHEGSPEDLILDKTIAGIFESDKIVINPLTGDFEHNKHGSNKVCFTCDDENLRNWTVKALERSGYEITDFDKDLPVIRAEIINSKNIWKIQRFNEILIFVTIYDLISSLRLSEY